MATLTDDEAQAVLDHLVTQQAKQPEPKPLGNESQPVVYDSGNPISDEKAQFMLEQLQQQQPKPNEPSVGGDLARGIDELTASGGGLISLLGNLAGNKTAEDWGMDIYKAQQFQASRNPARVGDYENVHNFSDLMKYAEEGIVSNLPMFLPGMAVSGIGGIAARSAGKAIMASLVEEQVAKGLGQKAAQEAAAKIVAKRIAMASASSGVVSTSPQEMGSIYGDTYDETGVKQPLASVGLGLGAGLMEALPEARLWGKVLGPKVEAKLGANLATRVLGEGAKQSLFQATTEVGQSIFEQGGPAIADPHRSLLDEKAQSDYVNTFLQTLPLGFITGGLGGAFGDHGHLKPHPDPAVNLKQAAVTASSLSQAPAVQPAKVTLDPTAVKLDAVNDNIKALVDEKAKLTTDDPGHAALDAQLVALGQQKDDLEKQLNAPETTNQVNTNESQIKASGTVGQQVQGSNAGTEPSGVVHGTGTQVNEAAAGYQGGTITETPKEDTPEQAKDRKRVELLQEKSFLENLPEEGTSTRKPRDISNRLKEIKALLANDQQLAVANTDPTYNFPKSEVTDPDVTSTDIKSKRQEGNIVAASLVNENTEAPKQDRASFLGAIKAGLERNINLLAGLKVKLKAGREFKVESDHKGNLTLFMPSLEAFDQRNREAGQKNKTVWGHETIPHLIDHEVTHLAHLQYIKHLWEAKGRPGSFAVFANDNLRKMHDDMVKSYEYFPSDLKKVYNPSGKDLSPEKAMAEFMRGIVERARKGMLSEDMARIQAIARQNGGKATRLQTLFHEAIKRLYEVFARYLNKTTAPKGFRDTFEAINAVMDQYGVVRPDIAPPVTAKSRAELKAKLEGKTTAAKTETPATEPEAKTEPKPKAKKESKTASRQREPKAATVTVTQETPTMPPTVETKTEAPKVEAAVTEPAKSEPPVAAEEPKPEPPKAEEPKKEESTSGAPVQVEKEAQDEVDQLTDEEISAIASHESAPATPPVREPVEAGAEAPATIPQPEATKTPPPEVIAPKTFELSKHIRSKVSNVAEFTRQLVKTLGEKARRMAKAMWKRVNTMIALGLAVSIAPTNIQEVNAAYTARQNLTVQRAVYHVEKVSGPNIETVNIALTNPDREVKSITKYTNPSELEVKPSTEKAVTAADATLAEQKAPEAAPAEQPVTKAEAEPAEDAEDNSDVPVRAWKADALVAEKQNKDVGGSVVEPKREYDKRAAEALAKQKEGKKLTPMEVAWTFYGEQEGENANIQKILDMFGATVSQDKYPWCAPFMSYALSKGGSKFRAQSAKAFLNAGKHVDLSEAKEGNVVVLWNDNPETGGRHGWGGHVAFVVAHEAPFLTILGGNQHDAVNVSVVHESRVLGVRDVLSLHAEEEDSISDIADEAGAVYQGTNNNGDHVFKEIASNSAFTIKDSNLTPESIHETADRARQRFENSSVWHVTLDKNWQKIQTEGLRPMQTSNFVKSGSGERYGSGEIYSFSNFDDAVRMAARLDWINNQTFGSGNIKILELKDNKGWEIDDNDPLTQSSRKGDWLKKMAAIDRSKIARAIPFDDTLAKRMREQDITPPSNSLVDEIGDEGTISLEAEQSFMKDKNFEQAINTQADIMDRVFHPSRMESGNVRSILHAPSLDFSDVPEVMQDTTSVPHSETILAGVAEIRKRGLFTTINDLIHDPAGIDFNRESEVQQAILEVTRRSLDSIIDRYEDGESEIVKQAHIDYIYKSRAAISQSSIESLTSHGRATSMIKGFKNFMTRSTAKTDYFNLLKTKLNRYFGKNGERFNNAMLDEINKRAQDVIEGTSTRAEFVSFLKKMVNEITNNPEWRKAARESYVVKSERKFQAIIKKMTMNASEREHGNFEDEPALQEAYSRLLSSIRMLDPGRVVETKESAPTALSSAITKVFNDAIRDKRLVNENPAKTKIADLQKLSAILTNQDLYNRFVDEMEHTLMSDPNASPELQSRVSELIGELRDRSWSDKLLQSVVVNKAKEMNLGVTRAVQKAEAKTRPKLDKIAKLTEKEVQLRIDAIKEEILKELGSDALAPSIVHQLSEEIDAELERQVNNAREEFAATVGGMQKPLKEIGMTIAEVAKSNQSARNALTNEMALHFIEQLGLSDTDKFPHATTLKDIFTRAVTDQLNKQREEIKKSAIRRAKRLEENKAAGILAQKDKKGKSAIDKLIDMASLGGLDQKELYQALQDQLKLPEYDPAVAKHIADWGERISQMELQSNGDPERDRTIETQKLLTYIASREGLSKWDMAIAYMYVSMLSGPGTHLVNAYSNAFNLVAEIAVQSARKPSKIPQIFSAMIHVLPRAAIEFRDTLSHGVSAGKALHKATGNLPLEQENPMYKDKTAKGLGWLMTKTKANMIGRLLAATDMFFYKAAQELYYSSRGGYQGGGELWSAALSEAQRTIASRGGRDYNPDEKSNKRKIDVLAMKLFERMRLTRPGDEISATAWMESHAYALRTTFNQDPKGPIGELAKMLGKWSEKYPLVTKPFIPFTKVVANVLNSQVEWSPLGFVRWWYSDKSAFNEGFADKDGVPIRNPEILTRAIIGTAGASLLFAILMKAEADNPDDPWVTLYGDGPRDANRRRQLYDRGWRPNTFKIGHNYISYQNNPMSLPLAAVGTIMDRRRDSPNISIADYAPQAALAMGRSILNQSFVSGIAGIISSLESSSPDKEMQRTLARTSSILIPNFFKQIDAWISPGVQNSQSFIDMTIKQIPVVRWLLKPMLNVFGEEVSRVQGPLNVPFANRFWTMEKTNDPVYDFIGTHQVSVPGFSPSTKLGDKTMTNEQFYNYVKIAGPMMKQRIRSELPELLSLTREQMQKRVEEITHQAKSDARDILRRQ